MRFDVAKSLSTGRTLYRRYSSGLTLIELMVAMVLSLLLMAGVLTIFTGSKTSYQLQTGLAAVQENGRYALHLLVRDIRGAGFGGCAGIEAMTVNVVANNMPDSMTLFTAKDVLHGKNDVAAGEGDPDYDAVVGTDVLIVRGAEDGLIGRVDTDMASAAANSSVSGGDILMISDCRALDIFRATSVSGDIAHSSTDNASGDLYQAYGRDAYVLKFRSNTYFVKDTGRNNQAGNDIVALYRRDAEGNDTELVEGIEDMQINYGIDSDSNGVVDRFVDAAVVESESLWGSVLAVEVALLVNSVENAHSEPVPYTYVGLASIPAAPLDFKLRQELAATVTIRNRVE